MGFLLQCLNSCSSFQAFPGVGFEWSLIRPFRLLAGWLLSWSHERPSYLLAVDQKPPSTPGNMSLLLCPSLWLPHIRAASSMPAMAGESPRKINMLNLRFFIWLSYSSFKKMWIIGLSTNRKSVTICFYFISCNPFLCLIYCVTTHIHTEYTCRVS